MHSMGDNTQTLHVAFTDPEIENERVLTLFLNILKDGVVGNTNGNFAYLRELALFLHKWGCGQVRQQVIYALESAAWQGRGCSLRLFVVAVSLQAPELCVLIVRSRAEETEPSNPSRRHGTRVPEKSIWCPSSWPKWFWAEGLPHKYMFALAKASGMEGDLSSNLEKCLRF